MKLGCPPLHRALLPRPLPATRLLSPHPLPLSAEEDPSSSHRTDAHLLRHPTRSSFLYPFFATATAGGRTVSVVEVQALHAHLAKMPAFHSDGPYFANCLADAYRKAGFLDDARYVLGEIPQPNGISWNLTISIHNQCFWFVESLRSFRAMRRMRSEPTEVTYGIVLSACAMCGDVRFGGQVHGLVMKNGFLSNGYVMTGLVDLFAKSCHLDEAVNVFSENPTDNVVVWNAVIAGSVRNGENGVALDLFHRMISGFHMPNEFTLSSVLTACTGARELELGRGIHGWVIKRAVDNDVVVGTALVDLYAKCGDIDGAIMQFQLMRVHNVVSWTTMVSAFAQEDPTYALLLFKYMIKTSAEVNKYTVTSVLAACGSLEMVKEAVQIHCWVLKSGFSTDPVVRASLISMYAKSGENEMSEKAFEEEGVAKDVPSWASMISGLVQNESSEKCFHVLQKMFQDGFRPDKICCCSVLSIVTCMDWGKQIHSYIVKAGLVLSIPVSSALFTMYSKCGSLDDSYKVFELMPERDGVAWTSMVAGLTEHGHADDALHFFREMLFSKTKPDQMTFSYALTACADLPYLTGGKEIHGHALRAGCENDMLVGGALISMYSKCKMLDTAVTVFHRMPQKDQFSWSKMVSGYAQNGCTREALLAFRQMLLAGFKMDHFSCSSVIGVCADLSQPILGKQLHAFVTKVDMLPDPAVSSALVTMYSKCGRIDYGRKVFDQVDQPDLITWTAMIDGYSQNGKGEEALEIYNLMRQGGTKPDSLTFVSLLSACSHNGLVEEGFLHFNSMAESHGIEPEAPHYACMVDLLGRAGRLREAADFIQKMPVKPSTLVWSTLLGACRLHGDVELGRFAAQMVLELEPSDSGAYISLSNMSADLGDWKEAFKIRNSMRQIGVKKEPGWSFVG